MNKGMKEIMKVVQGTYDKEYTDCILKYARDNLVTKDERDLIDTYFEIQQSHGRDSAITWLATAVCNVKGCDAGSLCRKQGKK